MQVLNQTTKVRLLYTSTTQSQCQEMPQLKISRHGTTYTLTRPFSLHVLRQTVSRNMGYEVCQEVALQSVNKGVLKLQRAVKKERSRASHLPCKVWVVQRLICRLQERTTQLNMLQSYLQPPYSLLPHKNPKPSKSIRHNTQPVHIHTLTGQRFIMCTYTYFLFSRQPHKRPCFETANVLNYSCTLELKSSSYVRTEQRIAVLRTTQKNVSTYF